MSKLPTAIIGELGSCHLEFDDVSGTFELPRNACVNSVRFLDKDGSSRDFEILPRMKPIELSSLRQTSRHASVNVTVSGGGDDPEAYGPWTVLLEEGVTGCLRFMLGGVTPSLEGSTQLFFEQKGHTSIVVQLRLCGEASFAARALRIEGYEPPIRLGRMPCGRVRRVPATIDAGKRTVGFALKKQEITTGMTTVVRVPVESESFLFLDVDDNHGFLATRLVADESLSPCAADVRRDGRLLAQVHMDNGLSAKTPTVVLSDASNFFWTIDPQEEVRPRFPAPFVVEAATVEPRKTRYGKRSVKNVSEQKIRVLLYTRNMNVRLQCGNECAKPDYKARMKKVLFDTIENVTDTLLVSMDAHGAVEYCCVEVE